jgi:methyl-accepting chemotaxis protein
MFSKFQPKTITGRLAAAFATLLVLLTICQAVGFYGHHILGALSNEERNAADLAHSATQLKLLVLQERRNEKDSFINLQDTAERKAYRATWDKNREALLAELAAIRKLALSAEDQKTLEQLAQDYQTYSSGYQSVYAHIESGAVKTTQEANDELKAYKDAVHSMELMSDTFHESALARAAASAGAQSLARSRISWLQWLISLLCVAAGVVLCVFAARSITRPILRAIEIARAIAGGKFDNPIDASGSDETAQLLSALEVMQAEMLRNELNAKGQMAAVSRAQAVIEFGLDGKVLTANDNFLRTFGYGLEEIKGQHHSLFVEPASRASAEYRQFWEKLARGEFEGGVYRLFGKGGKELWIQASYNPILDLQGKPFKVVKYANDISAQRSAELAVEREVQEIVAAVNGGDLEKRVSVAGKKGFYEALARGINQLSDNMSDIVSRVKLAAGEVSRGAEEISQGNANLGQRTEEQASSLEETASSMEQMTSTVKHNADNAGQANQLSAAARDQAEKGGAVVTRAVKAMSEINEASKKIADIIGVIDEIAFQTNLLALNAAVEAARAGEQGRGFAVVASEVRSLAGRSATAAKEIKGLIKDSVSKVEEGSVLVSQSGQTLEQIVSAVKKVSDIVAEIAAAAQEQSAGIDQVNKAVMQLDEMTQQNAALVEEASAASQSMAGQARSLNELMARYKVSQSASGAAAAAAARTVAGTAPARPAAAAPPAAERRGPGRPWSKPVRAEAKPQPAAAPKLRPRAAPAAAAAADGDWKEF